MDVELSDGREQSEAEGHCLYAPLGGFPVLRYCHNPGPKAEERCSL